MKFEIREFQPGKFVVLKKWLCFWHLFKKPIGGAEFVVRIFHNRTAAIEAIKKRYPDFDNTFTSHIETIELSQSENTDPDFIAAMKEVDETLK